MDGSGVSLASREVRGNLGVASIQINDKVEMCLFTDFEQRALMAARLSQVNGVVRTCLIVT